MITTRTEDQFHPLETSMAAFRTLWVILRTIRSLVRSMLFCGQTKQRNAQQATFSTPWVVNDHRGSVRSTLLSYPAGKGRGVEGEHK